MGILMSEQEILALIQQVVSEVSKGSGEGQFSSLYPYFVVGLLSYLLGRVNALHQDLKEYFKSVGGHLSEIRVLLSKLVKGE